MAAAASSSIGIQNEERPMIQPTLELLSLSDFKHDFTHDTSRIYQLLDNIKMPLDTKLSEFEWNSNKLKIRADISKIDKKISKKSNRTWTLYDEFREKMISYFPAADYQRAANLSGISEIDTLTEIIGRDMKRLRTEITTGGEHSIKGHTFNINATIRRRYDINAVLFKDAASRKFSIPNVLNKVTGKSDIAIIEDASTLPMSELTFEQPGDSIAELPLMNFYIIQSIENDSDSAFKTKEETYKPDTATIKKHFLKEAEQTSSVYSAFPGEDNTANVYTKYTFETTRDPSTTKIDGKFIIDDKSFEISDLGTMSQILNVSRKIVRLYIENYKDIKKAGNNIKKDELLSHFIIKKFGDWCQALCLLDTSRKYEYDNNKTITLLDIMNNPYGAVGVLTGDQILVSFCLLLGINVFYTVEENDNRWLLYLSNVDTNNAKISKVDVNAALEDILKKLETHRLAMVGNFDGINVLATTTTVATAFKKTLEELRVKTYKLSKIGYSADKQTTRLIKALQDELIDMQTRLEALGDDEVPAKDFQTSIFEHKFKTLEKAEMDIIAYTLNPDEGATLDDVILQLSTKTNLTLSGTMKQFETFLFTIGDDITDDIRIDRIEAITDPALQAKGRVPMYESKMKNVIITINKTIAKKIARGGTKAVPATYIADLDDAYINLRQRKILLLNSKATCRARANLKGITNSIQNANRHEIEAAAVYATKEANAEKESVEAVKALLRLAANSAGTNLAAAATDMIKFANTAVEQAEALVVESQTKSLDKYFIALFKDYVVDRNGTYCSVLDEYIITPDDCHIFLSVKDDACDVLINNILQKIEGANADILEELFQLVNNEETEKSTQIKYNYINLRFFLLWHDILYTRINSGIDDMSYEQILDINKGITNLTSYLKNFHMFKYKGGEKGHETAFFEVEITEDGPPTLRTKKIQSEKRALYDKLQNILLVVRKILFTYYTKNKNDFKTIDTEDNNKRFPNEEGIPEGQIISETEEENAKQRQAIELAEQVECIQSAYEPLSAEGGRRRKTRNKKNKTLRLRRKTRRRA